MKKFFNVIRSDDWWEFKFPPILAIAYVVALKSKFTYPEIGYLFVIILFSLITGAAYVSILNDITDVEEDGRAGKSNKMAYFTTRQKTLIVLIPVIAGGLFVVFCFGLYTITSTLYVLSYVCFTLYSLPPIRLKKRGFAGTLADALGSQVFPTLFVTAYLMTGTHQNVEISQLVIIGLWSLCFGLRGILWHQLYDAESDSKIGLQTFVHGLSRRQISISGRFIIAVELVTFLLLMITNHLYFVWLGLALYIYYLVLLYRNWYVRPVFITPLSTPYRIFMNEFYQAFFPVSILTGAIFKSPLNIILLIIHILLFPKNLKRIYFEFKELISSKATVKF